MSAVGLVTPYLSGSEYFPARYTSVLISTSWLHGIIGGYELKKGGSYFKTKHSMSSRPPRLYLGRMEHSRFSGCLENPIDIKLQEAAMSENLDSHNDSAMIRYRGL
jgi:hypothetical protein